jgi:hypothetical protein
MLVHDPAPSAAENVADKKNLQKSSSWRLTFETKVDGVILNERGPERFSVRGW